MRRHFRTNNLEITYVGSTAFAQLCFKLCCYFQTNIFFLRLFALISLKFQCPIEFQCQIQCPIEFQCPIQCRIFSLSSYFLLTSKLKMMKVQRYVGKGTKHNVAEDRWKWARTLFVCFFTFNTLLAPTERNPYNFAGPSRSSFKHNQPYLNAYLLSNLAYPFFPAIIFIIE